LNWVKAGSIAGALLFAILIVVIAIGPETTCSSKEFPFLCLVKQIFGR
jgi:hypothetical protein